MLKTRASSLFNQLLWLPPKTALCVLHEGSLLNFITAHVNRDQGVFASKQISYCVLGPIINISWKMSLKPVSNFFNYFAKIKRANTGRS